MRKLLVCLLATAILVVFSGVANAVTGEALVFTSPISFPVHLIKESQGTISTTLDVPKTTLKTKTQTFTGKLVANVTVTPETGVNDITINEVFFCGSIATDKGPQDAEIDFTNLATVLTDTFAGKGGIDANVTVDIIGTGDFFAPPGTTAVGIDYLNAKATGEFFSATQTVSKIHVSGNIAGGFTNADLTADLAPTENAQIFNATFNTTTLLQDATCTVAATCSATGTVVCTP